MKIGKVWTAAMALLILSGCGETGGSITAAESERVSESAVRTIVREAAGISAETEAGT